MLNQVYYFRPVFSQTKSANNRSALISITDLKIPFNIPVVLGTEIVQMAKAIESKKLSGNGGFTKKCQRFFNENFGFNKTLLTTSCTDALELAALACDIQPGDEVILPSFTFPSTANAFLLRGAKLVFVDSQPTHPNLCIEQLADLISPKTKAVVPVHYAGNACDMNEILALQQQADFYIIEDAAQAFGSSYRGQSLGSIGDFGTFSFHDTKNISCGEGGLLCVNNNAFAKRAEILWEKGTNRQAFLRGDVEKYGWVDLGSSYYPSELNASFLSAQLEASDTILNKRISLWSRYSEHFESIPSSGKFRVNQVPDYASNNAHIFYVVFEHTELRQKMIESLKREGIGSAFHYQSLHRSSFFREKHDSRSLPNADRFSDCLLRLPLFYDMTLQQVDDVCEAFAKTLTEI